MEKIMDDYFDIREKQVIMSGVTTAPTLCGHSYIVYRSQSRGQTDIHVNSGFIRTVGGLYRCCRYYDRRLCADDEELRAMTLDRIEAQAYNAWMDGAR